MTSTCTGGSKELNIRIPAVMHGLVDERGNLCEEGNPSKQASKTREPGSREAQQNLVGLRWLRFLRWLKSDCGF